MLKLMGLVAAVMVLFVVFSNTEEVTKGGIDPYILGLIGGTMLAVGVIMLVFTHDWSVRALGLVSVTIGVAILYLGALASYLEPSQSYRWSGPVTDMGRALLVVGGILLFVSLVHYFRDYLDRWR